MRRTRRTLGVRRDPPRRACYPPFQLDRSRSRPRARHDARFLWQVLLVVPPVVILSVVALYLLRQDRASIEQDARTNASALASELARRFGERIRDDIAAATAAQIASGMAPASAAPRGPNGARAERAPSAAATALQPLCGLILNGQIRLPVDYPALPSPPLWLYTLTSSEARQWRVASGATPQSDLVAVRRAVAALVRAPLPVRANAEWFLARAEIKQEAASQTVQRLADLAARFPDVLSESGTPLADLALLLALRLTPEGKPPDSLVRELRTRMLTHPSFMTTALVDEIVRRAADDPSVVWHAAETTPAGDRPVELASAAGRFELPLLVPSDAVATFAADLLRIAPQALPSTSPLPDGPVQLTVPSSGHAFTIGVNLISPDALYAIYRRRFWLAMGLILTATLAALGGLASTWHAFRRQRRLSEMKSNFVASVSHELRAPIAAVRLMTESLERGTVESDARQQEYLRAIGQECRRLSSLVDNVLDFSRIDQGRANYTFETGDIRALVAQTVELMRPYAAQRQIVLVDAAPPSDGDEVLQRRVDRQALQQALVNLIDNAIKHSPAGAEVAVGIETGPDNLLGLFVEDHGAGIPADEQERIFEPFYRRGSELRRETPGIGIGLSIVKHIAEAHGGRVVIRSSPGAGSRFTIELPFAAESEP